MRTCPRSAATGTCTRRSATGRSQYRDDEGRLVSEYVPPEGYRIRGNAETLEDFFPNLRRIRFQQPPQAPVLG